MDAVWLWNTLAEHIELAKASGWTCERYGVGTDFWLCSDPAAQFSGIGFTETEAWGDLLADPELWGEIHELIGARLTA